MHRLTLLAPRDHSDAAQGLVHRRRRLYRDVLGGHQTTRGVRVEPAELFRLLPRRRRHLLDDLFGALLVELLEHVRALVRVHLRDEGRGLLGGHRLQDFGAQLLVEVLEHLRRPLLGQRREKHRHPIERHRLGDVREIGRMHLLGLRRDLRRSLLEKRENVGSEQSADRTTLLRWMLGWRHATSSAAMERASPSK